MSRKSVLTTILGLGLMATLPTISYEKKYEPDIEIRDKQPKIIKTLYIEI